jgi:hypothetical protein
LILAEHPAATMLISAMVLTAVIAIIDKFRMKRNTKASSDEARTTLGDAIRFWELHRVFYNAILGAVVIGWVGLTWPRFSDSPTLEPVRFLIFAAVMANLLYSVVYFADIPLRLSDSRAGSHRWRVGLWLIGTMFAVLIENYWIADEIYPYAR